MWADRQADGFEVRADATELSSAWGSYVPGHVLRLLASHADALPLAAGDPADVVVLFADVAGFTPMSEALARSGPYGTEELSGILNNWFDTMCGQIAHFGGSVVEFAGDALAAVFDHTPRTRGATVRRSAQCALAMQSEMDRFQPVVTRAGPFHVAMKVGLAAGPLLQTVVGDPGLRLGYLQTGPALERAAAAEHHARAGEVVVDGGLIELGLGDALAVRDGEWFLVSGLRRRAAPARRIAAAALDHRAALRLAPFLHPAIAERLRFGRRELVNEHRKVTAVFVGMPSVPVDDRQAVVALQRHVAAALRLIAQYGGYFRHVAVDGRGSVLVAFFGAPVSHEDDEERAVRCGLDLLRLPGGPYRIGLGTGAVYCGEVGTEARREYAVIGDSVNLAARLMQVAEPDQILIDESTYTRVHAVTVHHRLRPIPVKGKSGSVDVWAVHALREPTAGFQHPGSAEPLVGRHDEVSRCRALVDGAQSGAGQVVLLSGNAGVGKSRLASEITAIARRRGFVVVGGACRSHATTTSYLVWRSIWRDLLGLDNAPPIPEQQRLLVDRLARQVANPAERAPLLAPVLNLPMPDSELIAPLDPQARDGLLRSLLLECLGALSGSSPILLMLEDTHWIDPASAALLDFLARGIGGHPILILVVTRATTHAAPIPAALRPLGHFTEFRLAELGRADAERLVDLRLRQRYPAGAVLDKAVVHRVVERGEGNPFYLEELVNYLHATGMDVGRPRALAELELPDGLQRLLMARLDQLSEGEQATIKVASVIGRRFRAAWIADAYPAVGGLNEVARHLERLHELDLTPRRAGAPEPEYEFKHALTQEATYQSLTFRMREFLHERVGLLIEDANGDRLAQYVDVLAHHYGRTQRTDKQRLWFRAAGDAAKAAYANEVAETYYHRLLSLLPTQETGDVLVELGGVWHVTGRWVEAERAYREAMTVARAAGRPEILAASQRDLGDLFMYNRSYAEAVVWLRQAADGFDRLDDQPGLARTLERLTFALYRKGEYPAALAAAERHRALVISADDLGGLSMALNHIGLVHLDAGRFEDAGAFLQQALDTATAAADRRCLLLAAMNLALVHLRRGEHVPSLTHGMRALEVAQEIGFRQLASLVVGNMGEIYRDEGDNVRAARCVAYALQIALELEDWTTVADQVANAAVIAVAQGQDGAEGLYLKAIALVRHLDAPYMLCGWLHQLAELHAAAGRFAVAAPLNQEALDVAEAHDRRDVRVRATVLAGRLDVELGRMRSDEALGVLRSLADDWTEPQEQALILRHQWQLDPRATSARLAAADLYERLYTGTPTVEYRAAYADLTGSTLAPGPPLPPLPDVLETATADIGELLRRVDEIVPRLIGADPRSPASGFADSGACVLAAASGRLDTSESA